MIEEMAKVLAIAMGFRKGGQFHEALSTIREVYDGFFPFDREWLEAVDPDELVKKLTEHWNLSEEEIRTLASYLIEEAKTLALMEDPAGAEDRYEKALRLEQYLEGKRPEMVSFGQIQRSEQIRQALERLKKEMLADDAL